LLIFSPSFDASRQTLNILSRKKLVDSDRTHATAELKMPQSSWFENVYVSGFLHVLHGKEHMRQLLPLFFEIRHDDE